MKKALVIIIFFIVFLLIYFVQANFFKWFNIAGIKPNLYILFCLFIGLYLGKIYGFSLGIIFGFLLDLFIGKRIGLYSIMLGIAGIIGGTLNKSFARDSRITFILMSMGVTILCEVINYTLQIILISADANFMEFMKKIIIEALYNAILTTVLYSLIQRSGEKTEEIFTERKSLMKYY